MCVSFTKNLMMNDWVELNGYMDLINFTSLSGVKLADDCILHNSYNITSLDGVKLPINCRFHDLCNIISLNGGAIF